MVLMLSVLVSMVSLLLTVQSAHSLYLMIYMWDNPELEHLARVPDTWAEPSMSFTAILPARHEEAVIGDTIARVVQSNYPSNKLQVLVVLSADDIGTIEVVEGAIEKMQYQGYRNIELVIFEDGPVNKPHGLNTARHRAKGGVITIFDAEDEMHPDIFNIVNTIMVNEGVKVVQAGVQLMNFESNWYSIFNVLEYMFWFRSRMYYHAKVGAVLLGGNTVFFERGILEELGGWNETNLTEDAEMGLRISAMGEKIRIAYDYRYVTRECTPPTVKVFIKQRTRWSQGFVQTFKSGVWKDMPTRGQRWLAAYSLVFPRSQVLMGLYLPVAFATTFLLQAPTPLALVSWLPVFMLGAHLIADIVGIYEFGDKFGKKVTKTHVAKMVLGFFPYQLLLTVAAIRAFLRSMKGNISWEKTQHTNDHRK